MTIERAVWQSAIELVDSEITGNLFPMAEEFMGGPVKDEKELDRCRATAARIIKAMRAAMASDAPR